MLLAATGSVATVKVPEIAVRLAETFEVVTHKICRPGGVTNRITTVSFLTSP